MLVDDFDGCLQIGMELECQGAQVLDLSSGWASRNEKEGLVRLVRLYSINVKAPLMLDSTSSEVLEVPVSYYPERPIINSINLEDGGKTLDTTYRLVKKYCGCATALTIDEQGMTITLEKKLEVAKRIYDLVTRRHGIPAEDKIFFLTL